MAKALLLRRRLTAGGRPGVIPRSVWRNRWFGDIEHFGKGKAMNAEPMKPTKRCESGTASRRQCAVFLAIVFVSAAVGGAIGGVIGSAIHGPNPGDWGVAAGVGFAVGAGLAPYITMALFSERH